MYYSCCCVALLRCLQLVKEIQHHQKPNALHLAFRSLPGQQQRTSQTPSSADSAHGNSSSLGQGSQPAARPIGLRRDSSSSSLGGPSTPTAYGPLPMPVPVVSLVAPPAVRRAVSTVDRHCDADAQPSAPVLPGSVNRDGPGVGQGGSARRISDPSSGGSSNRLQVAHASGVEAAGKGGSYAFRSYCAHGTGSSGSGHLQPAGLQPVVFDTSGDGPHSWHGGNHRGSHGGSNGCAYGPPSCSYSLGASAGSTAVAHPGRSGVPGAVNTVAVGGSSAAGIEFGQHQWRMALAAARNRPEAAEGWRQLGLARQGERDIDLSCQGLTDREVEAIAHHAAPFWSEATSVDLSNNSITGLGMVPLAQHAARHWR